MFRQAKRRSGEVGSVLFYHVSTWRILECTIGFEAVVGVREAYHEHLGLVGIRIDDLRENPAWRQQTGSSTSERYLMFLTIGPASGGRQQSGKHVGNTGNQPGKLLPVWCRHAGIRRKNRLDQPQTAGNSREAERTELVLVLRALWKVG